MRETMENYRLPFLEIIEERREVRYLGYIMKLTAGEYRVLKAIFNARECLDVERIRHLVSAEARMSASSIPVHVTAINKKSVKMGGRKLIGFRKERGYFIRSDI